MQLATKSGSVRYLCLFITLASVSACDDFSTPAELSIPQVLAIRAQPPVVNVGETTELELFLANSDGRIASPDVTWTVTPTNPGEPRLGQVVGLSDGRAMFTAPDDIPENPSLGSVTATIRVPGDPAAELVAIKGVILGTVPLVNPTMTGLSVDGSDILLQDTITADRGRMLSLELATDPEISDMSTFAWYTTVGEIEAYQSNPTTLNTGEDAGSGWLFAVVRDGLGGVTWHSVGIVVE